MTTGAPGYRWKLRQVMAGQGMWKASELSPLLAERGVSLSPSQVYRLVAKSPERLSLSTLAALCDIFSCTPNDLVELGTDGRAQPVPSSSKARPRRARVVPT